MKRSDFYFDLPQELVAQTPLPERDKSRLMCMDRRSGRISHHIFSDIKNLLKPGDLLVLNNSKVLPARLYGQKENTGGAIEFLLLEQKSQDIWEIIVKPGKKAKPGARFSFGDGLLNGEILEVLPDGNRFVRFTWNEGTFFDVLDRIGQMPLPHYITQELKDKHRYQTVYAKDVGSAAAPTAGLHFTEELLSNLKENGINLAFVTLHVGLGTFRPVKADNITDHKMHSEHYFMPKETSDLILETKKNGGRVIAVGTTSCRTIESIASTGGIRPAEGYTDIFIYPGYEFKAIDGIITNFHLPESTLIMLVSAFAGKENTLNAYNTAVNENYRFFSFGDAMFIADFMEDIKCIN